MATRLFADRIREDFLISSVSVLGAKNLNMHFEGYFATGTIEVFDGCPKLYGLSIETEDGAMAFD
jgi:hypothetical protein